jgi:hypothetical protein
MLDLDNGALGRSAGNGANRQQRRKQDRLQKTVSAGAPITQPKGEAFVPERHQRLLIVVIDLPPVAKTARHINTET